MSQEFFLGHGAPNPNVLSYIRAHTGSYNPFILTHSSAEKLFPDADVKSEIVKEVLI